MQNESLPNLSEYKEHSGTVKMAGSTTPRKAAWRAFALIENKVENVEFLFVGASAGQQTVKAIGILTDIFDQKNRSDFTVLFRPLRFKTTIQSSMKEVDAQVWRVYVIDLSPSNEKSL